jgi:hypothetical protein
MKQMALRSTLALLALAVLLPACGGGGGSPTAPAPGVTGPTRASIAVAQNGKGMIGISPLDAFMFRMRLPLRIVESAGLGANIHYLRLSLRLRGREVERLEIGSAAIIAQAGNNRLEASATRTLTASFDFNSDDFDTATLEAGFGDDRGNAHVVQVELSSEDFDFVFWILL